MTYHKTVRKPIPDYTTYNSPFATEKKPAYKKPARPRKVDKRVEEVYDVFTSTELPSAYHGDFVILERQKEMPEEYRLNFDEKYVSGLDHKQALLLADLISQGAEHKYRLPSLERTFDEVQHNRELKKLMKKGWMHNDEVITRGGEVRYNNSMCRATWDSYSFDGPKSTKIQKNDTVATLIMADLFHRTYPSYPNLIAIASDDIHFDKDGYASVSSCFDKKAFYAEAGPPSRRNMTCFIALVRSD